MGAKFLIMKSAASITGSAQGHSLCQRLQHTHLVFCGIEGQVANVQRAGQLQLPEILLLHKRNKQHATYTGDKHACCSLRGTAHIGCPLTLDLPDGQLYVMARKTRPVAPTAA